jgi:hypothetical protein
MAVGVSFTIITFITGEVVNETHVQLLDYLLVSTLGTGAIGAAKAGHGKYSFFLCPLKITLIISMRRCIAG